MAASEVAVLRTRWGQSPWHEVGSAVVEALHSGRHLKRLHLPSYEGRMDLRGLPLPQPKPKGRLELPATGPSPSFEFTLIEGRFKVENASVKGVDLSFSDLSGAVWRNCVFTDSLFRGARVSGGFFRNCTFEDVALDGAYLRDSLVGGCEGKAITSFRRSSFRNADLRNTYYQYPVFEDCDFSNALLDGVDFESSRFAKCRFAGKMTRVWFRGLSVPRSTVRGTPEKVWNAMTDVDFSAARLIDCMFVNRIDLSRCKFPSDGAHIVIRDREKVYDAMQAELQSSWQEPTCSEALKFLKLFAERKDKEGQKMDVVNRETFERSEYSLGGVKPWYHDYFELLQGLSRQGV